MSLRGRADANHPVGDMQTLAMRRKERNRMPVTAGVKQRELARVQAAELPG